MTDENRQRLVFVAGLHRSGTTPLMRAMAEHPEISGFSDTGVPEDEGQHLQTVYTTGRDHGAQGRFALDRTSHMNESHPLATEANARKLLEEWAPYWDLTKPVLLEKSPPNLVRMRFLQALFPEASFVVVMRHPMVTALATKKWARFSSWTTLVENWMVAHEAFLRDVPQIRRLHALRYEDFVEDPAKHLEQIREFLELNGTIPSESVQNQRSSGYADTWEQWRTSRNPLLRWRRRRLIRKFATRAQRFGYDMENLSVLAPLESRPS